jgi:hypothetical protein
MAGRSMHGRRVTGVATHGRDIPRPGDTAFATKIGGIT